MNASATIARLHEVFRACSTAPACVETGDGRAYVVKFKGAGGGERGLITEFIGLKIAALAGVRVPDVRPPLAAGEFSLAGRNRRIP